MRILTMLLFMVLLAGCGAAATPTGNATTGPATEPTTAAPAAEPTTAAPAETAVVPEEIATAVGDATEMIGPSALVLASLVQQLGVDPTSLQLVSAEEQQWPNPGLGCPEEGMMYTQVITPGYKITVTDGTTTYDVHTNETGDQAVLCQGGKPTQLTTAGS